MKSFYEFYRTMNELGVPGINTGAQSPQMQQQPQPQQPGAQGTSPPVPPPDANLMNGVKMLGQVKDPKFAGVFQKFMNQLQGLGISLPGQQYNPGQQPNQGQPNPASQQQQTGQPAQ